MVAPLHSRGSAAVADQTQAWFGPRERHRLQVRELYVIADGDLGFCSFLYHVSGTLAAGGEVGMWVRATLCSRRIDGRWLITHDHESVPFDQASGRR